MNSLIISEDSGSEDLAPIALAIHNLIGLPVTMRSKNRRGVRVEKKKVVDSNYTGPLLEQSLREEKVISAIPKSGPYRGKPIVVSPIKNKEGETIAAIGIVNIIGFIDLQTL